MERNCKQCKNPDCFWVGVDDDEICDEYLPKTNADRVRAMTDEELAEMLNHAQGDGFLVGIGQRKMSAYGNWLEWLKQEAKG